MSFYGKNVIISVVDQVKISTGEFDSDGDSSTESTSLDGGELLIVRDLFVENMRISQTDATTLTSKLKTDFKIECVVTPVQFSALTLAMIDNTLVQIEDISPELSKTIFDTTKGNLN